MARKLTAYDDDVGGNNTILVKTISASLEFRATSGGRIERMKTKFDAFLNVSIKEPPTPSFPPL